MFFSIFFGQILTSKSVFWYTICVVQTCPEMTKFLFTPPNSYHPNGKAFTHGPRKNLEIIFLLVKLILPPVDCNIVDWSLWSECSTTCGNGTETRNKNTTECSHVNETQPCNKGSCPGIHSCYDGCTDLVNNFLFKNISPVPFLFGPWEDTTNCTTSCRLFQTRSCIQLSSSASCQNASTERIGETACYEPPCSGKARTFPALWF